MRFLSTVFKKEITYHLLFWFSYLMLRIFFIQSYQGSFWYTLALESSQLPLKIAVTYAIIYLSIEKLLLGHRYWLFILSVVVIHYTAMLLNKYEDIIVSYFLLGNVHDEFDFWEVHVSIWSLSYFYPIIFVAIMLWILKRWYENTLMARTLSEAMAKAELKFLKEQLHPHFLFNTLNNIYALSLTQPAQVPSVMLRLSELLSYMLYESNNKFIPVKNEVRSIRDYVELEKLRVGERLELSFKVEGDMDGKMIAPMILLPFVENCFKHSSKVFSEKFFISIFITITENELTAQIENSKSLSGKPHDDTKNNGIGLSNVKKRLEILYPKMHELSVFDQDTFLVNLKIQLQSQTN